MKTLSTHTTTTSQKVLDKAVSFGAVSGQIDLQRAYSVLIDAYIDSNRVGNFPHTKRKDVLEE